MESKENHTIESGIVKDALLAIAEERKRGIYIGGGLSLQFDVPKKYHRLTTDLDLTPKAFTSYKDFKEFIDQAFSHLKEAGYTIRFKRGRNTFDAYLEREESKLMIQIPHRKRANYERRKPILDREFAHLRKKSLARGEIKVISLEDLVTHKVIRALAFMQSYGLNVPKQEELDSLMEKIKFLREDLGLSLMGLEPDEIAKKVADIRLHADVFDIKSIQSLLSGQFDEKYLFEAISSFDNKRGTPKEKIDFFYSLG